MRALSLNVQVRIAATQRTYSDAEEEALRELFGSPEQWGRSLQSLHWTNLSVQVPAFSGSTLVDLLVTCTYDLEVTAAKYLNGLDDGEVPLEFLFGGTLFYGEPPPGAPDLLERGGRVPAARLGLARDDGPLLPRAARGCGSTGRPSTASMPTGPGTHT